MLALIILASVAMAALIVTAGFRMNDASKTETAGAGPWGVMERQSVRKRPLSTQARRWQTAFTRSQSDQVRWSELVGYIDELETYVERTTHGTGLDTQNASTPTRATHEPPGQFDRRYLRNRIARLESLVDQDLADPNLASPDRARQSTAITATPQDKESNDA